MLKKPLRKPSHKVLLPAYEDQARQAGFDFVIGVDEAGRGPLAGPVVAAAVCLTRTQFSTPVTDSKKMSALSRERAFDEIYEHAYVGVGIMSETVIDRINILQATFCAMENAVLDLIGNIPVQTTSAFDFGPRVCIFVDGDKYKTTLPYAYHTIVQGDSKVLSIAAASIIAKVTRDRIISMYDKIFPQYDFAQHKGYPTPRHKALLAQYGVSPIHRKSFSY